jgi:tetratricopeptide (TPR) repeat protein
MSTAVDATGAKVRRDAESLCRKGMAAAAAGDYDGACVWIAGAIRISGAPRYCESLARVLTAQGKHQQAAACYLQALAGSPASVSLQLGLAQALLASSRPAEAAGVAANLLKARPELADAWRLLGIALHESGAFTDATAALRRALELDPEMARAHYDLGLALVRAGRDAEAEAAYRRALEAEPRFPEAHNNLGNLLRRRGRAAEAAACYRLALRYRPDFTDARYNLGIALQELERLEEAEQCYRQVLAARPHMAAAHNNLANTLQALGAVVQSIGHYKTAAGLERENAQYRVNLGMAQLLTGDYRDGWKNYAARTAAGHDGVPPWDGAPPAGRRILLQAEQGLGDTMQFIRYAARLKAMGVSVWALCPPPLAGLLRTYPALDGVGIEGEEPPSCEWAVSLLDIPGILGTTESTIPGEVPYLAADAGRARWWGDWLGGQTGAFKVGIAWRGSPQHRNDGNRSMDAAELSTLAGIPDVRFVSLQKEHESGHDAAKVDWLPLARPLDDLADTAALMVNLDLVISVDSAVAHLAGALARPVWTLLPFAPDWRWLLDREDTPWYPTMRLFRQRRRKDWPGVMARVREELCNGRTEAAGTRSTPRRPELRESDS